VLKNAKISINAITELKFYISSGWLDVSGNIPPKTIIGNCYTFAQTGNKYSCAN
jgi:hypothetical protein